MRTTISKNRDLPLEDIREVDQDTLVKLFRASGIPQAAIEVDGSRIVYLFSRKETQDLLNKVLSNLPVMIEWQKYCAAEEEWKRVLATFREPKREHK
jgi:hypothetical protein